MPSGLTFRRPKGMSNDLFNLIREQRAPRRIMASVVANTRKRSSSRRAFTRSRRGGIRRGGLGTNTSFIFPTSKITKHSLVHRQEMTFTQLNASKDSTNGVRMVANSHYAPLLISPGPVRTLPSALGYTLMATLYDHYFVLGSTCVVTACNTTDVPFVIGLNLVDEANILTVPKYEQSRFGKTMDLPAGGTTVGTPTNTFSGASNFKTMTFSYNPRSYYRVGKAMEESRLRGNYDSDVSPSELAFFHVFTDSYAGSTPTMGSVFVSVKVTYTVKNVEPKTLDSEATS